MQFLFKVIKNRRGEKVTDSDIQSVANFFDCWNIRSVVSSADNIIERWLRDSADYCKLIDGDFIFAAKFKDSFSDGFSNGHFLTPRFY